MSFPAYAEFKSIPCPEVGPIPVGWDARRLKFCASYNDDSLPETTDPDLEIAYVDISSVDLINGITAIETMTFEKAPSRARRIVRDGDTIISTVRTYLKAISPIKDPLENMIVSTGFAVIRPMDGMDTKYLGYALQESGFIDQVVANSTGVSYPAINPSSLVCIPVRFPVSLDEQKRIGDFLDWKTGQIDSLIDKKKALIERLKEVRLAKIIQAVTVGLGQSTPLRATNIDWIPRLPEHWKISPLGFLMAMSGGMTPNTSISEYWEGEIPWVTPKDMKIDYISDSIDHITELALKETGLGIIPEGSVLVVVRGMILAHSFPVAITGVPVTVNQDMKALRFGEELNAKYYFWCLTGFSKILSGLAQESAHGTRKVESDTLKKFLLPVPPLEEQVEIVHHLEAQLDYLDRMAEKIEMAISRLTEYRAALITAATTGKIDVRQVTIGSAV